MDNQTLLILNFVSYLLLFYLYQKKKKVFDLGSIMLLIWCASACGSCWYYSFHVVQIIYPILTIMPLLYILGSNIYLFYPLLKMDYRGIKKIETHDLDNLLYILSVIFAICSIPPFLNIIFKITSISIGGKFLGNMYSSGEDNANLIFLPTIKPFFSISHHFIQFIFFLFFYSLTIKKKNNYIILGLALNIITFFLFSLLSGSRGGIINLLLNMSFYIFFMQNMFPNNISKKIKQYTLIGLVFLSIGIGAITVSRLSIINSQKDRQTKTQVDRWLAQYLGEGFIQFDSKLWNIEHTMNGEHNFPVIVGIYNPTAKDTKKFNSYQGSITKRYTYVFYTYVGDIVLDFGITGGIFVIILFGIFIRWLLKIQNGNFSIYRLLVLNFIFIILTMGITANVYRSYYNQMEIVSVLGLLFLLNIISKLNRNKV